MIQEKIVYLFTHIPKTGGTTLRIHFQKHMVDQQDFIHLANRGDKWARQAGLLPFQQRSTISRNKTKVILGHKVNYTTKHLIQNATFEEVVFFRNPIDWEISRFNQYVNRLINTGKKTITFDYWAHHVNKLHSQFDWFLANYLMLGPQVKKLSKLHKKRLLFYVLDNFEHVCFLSDFYNKSNYFFEILNLPKNPEPKNVVGKQKTQFYEKNTSNEDLLNNLCSDDVDIYNEIKQLYGKK